MFDGDISTNLVLATAARATNSVVICLGLVCNSLILRDWSESSHDLMPVTVN